LTLLKSVGVDVGNVAWVVVAVVIDVVTLEPVRVVDVIADAVVVIGRVVLVWVAVILPQPAPSTSSNNKVVTITLTICFMSYLPFQFALSIFNRRTALLVLITCTLRIQSSLR
jgi:uncharacterized RDD family membrane protein YckC